MSRPLGTPAELERRRRRAVDLMRQGESPTLLARTLGAARPPPSRSPHAAPSPPPALPPPGPTPRLSDAQLAQLDGLLRQGATAHGWANELWTAPRVTEVIRRHFGVSFHPEHVRKILKRRLH